MKIQKERIQKKNKKNNLILEKRRNEKIESTCYSSS